MNEILTAATVIVGLVLGVTQMIKKMVNDNKYLPIVNLVVGVSIGVLYALSIVKGDIAVYAWAGALAGLSAGGFYDLGSNTKAIANQSKSIALIDEGNGKQDNREEGE